MSILLLDTEENEPSKILERNVLINEKDTTTDPFINELEKSIHETTIDLPLGKALHLLLNVHGQVFDKAVASIQKSTTAELAIKSAESPTIKAVLSIQNYISKDVVTLFKQVYDSLKDKFLKRQPNEAAMRIVSFFTLHSNNCQIQVQQMLIDELRKSDKKDQLAVVVLLQFFFKHYNESINKVALVFLAPLLDLIEMRSDQPTLLNCSTCELALQFTRIALTSSLNTVIIEETSINKIMEVKAESIDKPPEGFWQGLEKILNILEKWQKSKTKLELAVYRELHGMVKSENAAWSVILNYITPKSVLSEKPFSIKKQKQVLSDAEADSSTQLLILTLLQKGQWNELYGHDKSTVIKSIEQDEIKSLVQQKYESSMHLKHLIPQLVTTLPHLFSCSEIKDNDLIQRTLDETVKPSDEVIEKLTPMVMNQPEPSICYLLMHIIQQDSQSQFAFDMLSHLITSETDQTVPILQKNLLHIIKQSNQACELLIKCMEYTDLTALIRELMKQSIVQSEREKMTCIALISKALLQEHWASNSILNYIELIREFKLHKGFVTKNTMTPPKGPQDIALSKPAAVETIQTFKDEEIETISLSLMISLQLWSTRVREHDFGLALRQLVQYSCGIPKDNTWIEAWKQLSFAFSNNHKLVWHVVEVCTDILRTQISITQDIVDETSPQYVELKEDILFLRISPLLILQTIPKEAYDVLQLPKSYVDLIAYKLEKIGVSKDMIKITQQQDVHSPISIQLMDELLQRSLELDHLGQDIKNPIEFSIHLLIKLFCV